MLDWPGRVAATLFLSGCGFTCPYCHNASLRTVTEGPVDWDEVLTHLEARRAWLDGVVVTGGEPTEDPDLPSLLAALKDAGYAVKLDTNGSHPRMLSMLLAENLVDAVAVDVKAGADSYGAVSSRSDMPERLRACVESLIGSGVEHEFRCTAYPGLVALSELPRIARSLRGGRLFAIQQFRPDPACLDPAARSASPYAEADLRAAAAACNRYLPTIVRGIAPRED